MNTTIRGHNLRMTIVMALLSVLLLLAVAMLLALRPAPKTGDRDAKPANHAVSGTGGSSISQNPDVKRHAEVVERLGNGSLR